MDGVLWAVQMLFMVVAVVFFYWPAAACFAIGRALRGHLGASIMRGPYYWLAVQRRKLKGEPLWQEHDLGIGIAMPPGLPLAHGQPQLVRLTNRQTAQAIRQLVAPYMAKVEELEALPPDEIAEGPR